MSCTVAKNPSRTGGNSYRALFTLGVLLLLSAGVSSAQAVFNQLAAFDGYDGYGPYYEYLAQGTDGQLYGTTQAGFVSPFEGGGAGSVFKVTTTGSLTDLYTFDVNTGGTDGFLPVGGLVLAPNGNFYGTTSYGGSITDGTCSQGCGTIFEITPTGTLTTLHDFTGTDGFSPYANLTLGTDGNLYGTTLYGGNINAIGCNGIGCGTVFKITLPANGNPTFASLYSFQGGAVNDGQNPFGRLFQASNGNFYGTTLDGGTGGYGTIFEITPAGKLTIAASFGDASWSAPQN